MIRSGHVFRFQNSRVDHQDGDTNHIEASEILLPRAMNQQSSIG